MAFGCTIDLVRAVLEAEGSRREDEEANEDEAKVRLPQARVAALDCRRIDLARDFVFIFDSNV